MKRSAPLDNVDGKDKDESLEDSNASSKSSEVSSEDSDSEEQEIAKWKVFCIGKMERGFGLTYPGMDKYDEPERFSYVWWGCVLISNITDLESTLNLMRFYPQRLTVVDNLTERAICVKLDFGGNPVTINGGSTPCVASTTKWEPEEDWFHFQYMSHRSFVHKRLDWISEICRHHGQEVRLHLVLGIHPLVLASFETKKKE